MSDGVYFVYIVRCRDGTLYTGITRDVNRRIIEHNSGRGAKYTRGRGPVELLSSVRVGDRSSALRLELLVKRQPRAKKLETLIAGVNDGKDPEIPADRPC
jgi:putative endonuclease